MNLYDTLMTYYWVSDIGTQGVKGYLVDLRAGSLPLLIWSMDPLSKPRLV